MLPKMKKVRKNKSSINGQDAPSRDRLEKAKDCGGGEIKSIEGRPRPNKIRGPSLTLDASGLGDSRSLLRKKPKLGSSGKGDQ